MHCRVECKNVSWNDEEKDNINQEIHSHMDLLNNIVDRELNNHEQVVACVDDLCNALYEIVLPKCHTKIVHCFKDNFDKNKKHVKVAYTSGPIFEKIMKRYPIFSMQIINYQIDQKYK